MSEEKQYAERDLMAMDIAGNHYGRHVSAMTHEQLHSKSDIAAELGWRDLQIAELKAQRDALAALADERRQFIVNGVEMGDILLPVIEGDPATGIYERCLLKPKFAHDAYLNSVRADAVVNAAAHLGDMASGKSASTAELIKSCGRALLAFAAQLRAGKESM